MSTLYRPISPFARCGYDCLRVFHLHSVLSSVFLPPRFNRDSSTALEAIQSDSARVTQKAHDVPVKRIILLYRVAMCKTKHSFLVFFVLYGLKCLGE